jgi:serine/threonine-protein kinase
VATKSPDRVGLVVGQRYELLAVIGRGGQGMVYRAFDRWLGRAVAVKVLGSKAAREPQVVERLMREQQALSVLKGTAAVQLFDVCRGAEGELCLVMELLTGVDLDEYLFSIEERRERLSLTRIAEIFEPIVETLETAHAAGILHRDLKPANIFLLEGGDVRLLDFGMARLKNAAPLTAAGTVMGSPSFMAPEAWKGVSDLLDQRADVYSLGVILFRVLAGELPFSGVTLKDKFLSATTAARPSLLKYRPDLPRDADDWVRLALAADRDARFQNVRALWNVFLAVFHVTSPRAGKRPSFWAAAKGAVQRVAFGGQPAAPARAEPTALPKRDEPSFTREALAKSIPVERTLSMSDSDIVYELGPDESAPAAPSSPKRH